MEVKVDGILNDPIYIDNETLQKNKDVDITVLSESGKSYRLLRDKKLELEECQY